MKKLCQNCCENVTAVLTRQKTTSEDYLRLNIDIDNKNADVLCLEDCIVKGTGPLSKLCWGIPQGY